MVICAVPNCAADSRKKNKNSNIGFHRFPKDQEKKSMWERQVNRADWKATEHSRICSRHFKEDCFYIANDGSRQLHQLSIPTEMLPERETDPLSGKLSALSHHKRKHIEAKYLCHPDDTPKEKMLKRKVISLIEISEQRKRRIRTQNQTLRRMAQRLHLLKQLLKQSCSLIKQDVQSFSLEQPVDQSE